MGKSVSYFNFGSLPFPTSFVHGKTFVGVLDVRNENPD